MAATDALRVRISGAAVAALISIAQCLAPGGASAEDYAAAETYLHGFNNGVAVYTGVFSLYKDLSPDTSASFKYTVDFIDQGAGEGGEEGEEDGEGDHLNGFSHIAAVSGASAAVSSAGGSATDARNELTFGVAHDFRDVVGVEAYADYSTESDYESVTPAVTLKKDLFEKNTTLAFGYSRSMDEVSGQLMEGPEDRTTDNYFFGVTQVISPVLLAQAGYSRGESRGYESEGIRLVPVGGASLSSCTAISSTCLLEAFPGERKRDAYIVGISRYFAGGPSAVFERSSAKLTLRYYKDDWEIESHTGEVEYNKYLAEALVLRLNYRYYDQSGAFFAKDAYTGEEEYMTSSPQLERLTSNLFGAKLTYSLRGAYGEGASSFIPRLGSVEGKYEYYVESTGVNAHILMAGVRIPY